MGMWWCSRGRPLPVFGMPIRRALSLSEEEALEMRFRSGRSPVSGVPSSSTFRLPRRPASGHCRTTVTLGLGHLLPISPAKAEFSFGEVGLDPCPRPRGEERRASRGRGRQASHRRSFDCRVAGSRCVLLRVRDAPEICPPSKKSMVTRPPPPAAARAVFVALCYDEDVEARKGLGVAGEGAVGGCNEDTS